MRRFRGDAPGVRGPERKASGFARRVPFEDASFDVVTMVCVYHHVDLADRPALTADVSRVLKPEDCSA